MHIDEEDELIKLKFFILSFLLVNYCSFAETKNNDTTEIHKRLLGIAEQYILHNYPGSSSVERKLKPVILEKNRHWVITFELPELAIGGVPFIHISKDDLKVIKAYHTQ